MKTKIAVATKDGHKISGYFGSSRIFKIFEINGNKIINNQLRDSKNPSINNENLAFPKHHNEYGQKEMLNMLADCEIIFTKRMSKYTWNEFGRSGKEIIFTNIKDADKNIQIYLEDDRFDAEKMHH